MGGHRIASVSCLIEMFVEGHPGPQECSCFQNTIIKEFTFQSPGPGISVSSVLARVTSMSDAKSPKISFSFYKWMVVSPAVVV